MSKSVFIYRPMYGMPQAERPVVKAAEALKTAAMREMLTGEPAPDKDALIADLRAQLEALKAKVRERVKKHRAKTRPPI